MARIDVAAQQPRFGLCGCGHEGIDHAVLTDYCKRCSCESFHRDRKE